jgi:hypothetical protein
MGINPTRQSTIITTANEIAIKKNLSQTNFHRDQSPFQTDGMTIKRVMGWEIMRGEMRTQDDERGGYEFARGTYGIGER